MSDWKDDKDLGPWTFTKSPPKNYYNEGSHISSYRNPVWSITRVPSSTSITPKHNPHCGYWPRPPATPPPPATSPEANIFGLFSSGSTIWGCYFDGVDSLTFIGFYETSGDINCLLLDDNDDTLVTVAGDGSTAELRKIGTTPTDFLLPLDSTITPFNDYDVTLSTFGDLVRDPDTGIVYYAEGSTGNQGGTLIKLNGTTYEKQLRSYIGITVIGTDTDIYFPDSYLSDWNAAIRPVTGEFWNTYWVRVPDQLTDVTPNVWGEGAVLTCATDKFRLKMYSDSRFYGLLSDSPPSRLRTYDPSDLTITDSITLGGHPVDLVYHNGYIYTISGYTNCTLRKYLEGSAILIDEVGLSPGRADEIILMGENLIILNNPYTATNQMFKVNPGTMTVIDQYNFPETDLWQKIARIDDTFLAVGGNNWAMVFNVDTFTVVDTAHIDHVDLDGYATRDLVVQTL